MPVLIKVVQMTDGPILELGTGLFSTPFLHWACFDSKRELVSYDHNEHYVRLFKRFNNDHHRVLFAEDWDKIKIERLWDVVLVDHDDDRRVSEIKRLADYAKYIIVHDTGPKSDYHHEFSELFPMFKYRHDHTKTSPHTSVLSNFVDLSNL